MRRKTPAVHLLKSVALAACLVAGTAQAQYSGTWFFGDSLTDSGFYKALGVLPPGTGKFTTNPGAVWAETLASRYGFSATPSNAGGTDYAQGGARVTGTPGVGAAPADGAQPIKVQIDTFLAANPSPNGNGLYTVWAGANDIFFQAGLAGAGAITAAQAQANVATAAQELAVQVQRLRGAGARWIIVPNVPDIGATPYGASLGAAGAAQMTALSRLYNGVLAQSLAAAGGNVVRLDTFGLLRAAAANPSAYGFSNVTVPACGATASLICTSANFVAPGADQTFLFADGVHPSSAGHAMLAQYAASVLQGPTAVSMLAETPVRTRQAHLNVLSGEMLYGSGAQTSGNRVFVSADYQPLKVDGSATRAGLDGNAAALTVGVDRRFGSVLGGIALGLSRGDYDLSGNGGGYKQDDTTVSLYAATRFGPGWVQGALSYGKLDLRDISRQVTIGANTTAARGSTKGDNLSAAVEGGWNFTAGALTHGPLLGVTSQRVKVDGYSESGSGAADLGFGKQTRDSLISRLGWQLSYAAGKLTPYARLTFDNEHGDDSRDVSASLVSLGDGISFTSPATAMDRHWTTATLGVAGNLGANVRARLQFSSVLGQSGVKHHMLGVSFGLPF